MEQKSKRTSENASKEEKAWVPVKLALKSCHNVDFLMNYPS